LQLAWIFIAWVDSVVNLFSCLICNGNFDIEWFS